MTGSRGRSFAPEDSSSWLPPCSWVLCGHGLAERGSLAGRHRPGVAATPALTPSVTPVSTQVPTASPHTGRDARADRRPPDRRSPDRRHRVRHG